MRRWFVTICAVLSVVANASAGSMRKNPGRAEQSTASDANSKAQTRARRAAMASVDSWAIQLRYLNRSALAGAPVDMIVIDHAPHPAKAVEIPYTREEIAPLKIRSDGRRRIVLAYLSVGEAERYRYYWRTEWDVSQTRPKWLGAENPQWPGDYQVQFADPEWQALIFGTKESYLDRILQAGFDGVYLDRVDAFQDVEDTMPGAEGAMSGFVQRLADHARRTNPSFLIVMQNAEELAASKSLLSRLDGLSKEDLIFGFDNSDLPNPEPMLRDSVANLRKAKRAGVKVFALEYAATPEHVAEAIALTRREGFLLHITERTLGTLSVDAVASPSNSPAITPAR